MQKAPFSKILVGVDASDQTRVVLERAHILSSVVRADVVVCTVENVGTSTEGDEQDGFPANDQEQNTIDRIRELVHSEFLGDSEKIEIRVLHGDPAERISEYAEYLNCDLVIVGSRGQSGLKKALMGSVSSSVASRCRTSVLIVR